MAVVLVQNGVHSWPKSHLMHDKVGNDISSGPSFGHDRGDTDYLLVEPSELDTDTGTNGPGDTAAFANYAAFGPQ
jgi:hypothetical protein